jgi:hypothetical protein
MTKKTWTDAEVRKMLSNPVGAGVGKFPAIMDDALWVYAAARLIKTEGAVPFIARVKTILTELGLQVPEDIPVTGSPEDIAESVLMLTRRANPSD